MPVAALEIAQNVNHVLETGNARIATNRISHATTSALNVKLPNRKELVAAMLEVIAQNASPAPQTGNVLIAINRILVATTNVSSAKPPNQKD